MCDSCYQSLQSPAPGNHAFLTESSVKPPVKAEAQTEEKKEEVAPPAPEPEPVPVPEEEKKEEIVAPEEEPAVPDLPMIGSPVAAPAPAATPLASSKFMQLLSSVDVNKMNLSTTQKQQLSSLANPAAFNAAVLNNIPQEKLSQLKKPDGSIDPDKLSAEIEKERQYLMDLFALRFPDSSLAQEHLANKASRGL